MNAPDELDKLIQVTISWLKNNANIKIYQSQKGGLEFIVNMIIEKHPIDNEYWQSIKPPFYKSVNTIPINDFSHFVSQLADWAINNHGTDIKRLTQRLLVLKDLICRSEIMTAEEESKMIFEIKEIPLAERKRISELIKELDELVHCEIDLQNKNKIEVFDEMGAFSKLEELLELWAKNKLSKSDSEKIETLYAAILSPIDDFKNAISKCEELLKLWAKNKLSKSDSEKIEAYLMDSGVRKIILSR